MSGKSIALRATGILGWLGFLFFAGVIIYNSLGYFHSPDEMYFFEEKAPASDHWLWRASLYGHVAAGLLCFVASILQFFRGVLRRWPGLHRNLGRIYAHSVLWIVCPTGAYLAIFAKGGFLGQSGFMLLGVLTFVTTWKGLTEMWAGRTRSHARWMVRSFAMVTSAITFRLYHLAFEIAGWDYGTNYIVSLWLSIAGNAAAGEWLARLIPLSTVKTETPHETKADPALLHSAGYP
jgi:hypothetical protein